MPLVVVVIGSVSIQKCLACYNCYCFSCAVVEKKKNKVAKLLKITQMLIKNSNLWSDQSR